MMPNFLTYLHIYVAQIQKLQNCQIYNQEGFLADYDQHSSKQTKIKPLPVQKQCSSVTVSILFILENILQHHCCHFYSIPLCQIISKDPPKKGKITVLRKALMRNSFNKQKMNCCLSSCGILIISKRPSCNQ